MSQQALVNPKIFISYSWTTTEHEEWVVELATRLMHDGIEVILDKWDLKEGHDIYAFMEGMVKSSEAIDKVLIICDKGYKEKADGRIGGVGTEAQIITPQIYRDIQQEKFIPIVAERDEVGNHFIPTYMASRLYIDLSSPDYFEENYDKLIRNIYRVPLYKKPVLGKTPEYLLQNETPHFQTSSVLRQMKTAIDRYPNRLKHLWGHFSDSFYDSLNEINIIDVKNAEELDEEIVKMINKSIPLRNDYIDGLELMCLADTLEAEQIIEFFEKIYAYTEFQGGGSYYETQVDQYKFLITELFLYTIMILLKSKRYSDVSHILNADYYVESRFRGEKPLRYDNFRFYVKSLDIRNYRLRLNRVSLTADLIKERSDGKYLTDLLGTDLILYYISKISKTKESGRGGIWFPTTYIYFNEGRTIKLISRLKSKTHFSAVKGLFNVETESELKEKFSTFESDNGYRESWEGPPNIKRFIQPEEICTMY